MRNNARLVVLLLIASVISGCFGGDDSTPALFEGDEPGECSDGADNDQDGLFDCNDPNCAGAAFCSEPVIDDESVNQNETNNDDISLGPIELTNEMIDNGILDNNDCAVVIITTDWDAPSSQLMAQLTNFNNNNSNFELYVANLQNEQGEDILPTFNQFRGGILMPESIPSIAIISFEEQIITAWTDIQEAILVDIVCTLEQRDSISEAFTFVQQTTLPTEDLNYTRITNVTVTPENPHSHENPICSAQWESNEHDDEDLTILYSWFMVWNESAFTESEGNNPDSVWYSDFSEDGIFDRNDTDWRTNPNTAIPYTNVEIANQSISGKDLVCTPYLVTQALASVISELDYLEIATGALHSERVSALVTFQLEGSGEDCEGDLDCAGVCNGDSMHDECGVCGGDGSSCGGTDPADPEGGCGNITYTGCCSTDEDGNYTIITWCEDEVINTLNCGEENPGCGWDASAGYYNCVEAEYAGTEDPSGENPCDCSELE